MNNLPAEIPVSGGLAALVDEADFDELIQYTWHTGDKGYVVRAGNGTSISMSRQIMKAPKGMYVDHINGDILDNRRSNLRICSHTENCWNRKLSEGCASKFKGVNWHKKSGKWQARIKFERKIYHLGLFTLEQDAAHAYNEAAKKYFGEFARLNPIPADWVISTHNPQNLCQIRRGKNKVKCTSKYKGVGRVRKSGKWTARIKVDGKLKYLGDHDTEEAAALAYNAAAFAAWGRDAYLNDIEVQEDSNV